MLSALLRAIGRDRGSPVIIQEDLVAGCKLQMRGSLAQQHGLENKIVPTYGLDDVDLATNIRETADAIIRFEKSRSIVYGSWTGGSPFISSTAPIPPPMVEVPTTSSTMGPSPGRSSISAMCHSSTGPTSNLQRACISAFCGPTGSGKKTLMKAIAYDLGRSVKLVHVADMMTSNLSDTINSVAAIVQDARLADAVVALDGFEHVIDESSASPGEGSWKLHILLSRVLEVLHGFPGAVILLCHMDSPQNITLQRDFATKLFAFVRFMVPPHEVRAKLWRRMLPAHAPLAADVSFQELGRHFAITYSTVQYSML